METVNRARLDQPTSAAGTQPPTQNITFHSSPLYLLLSPASHPAYSPAIQYKPPPFGYKDTAENHSLAGIRAVRFISKSTDCN